MKSTIGIASGVLVIGLLPALPAWSGGMSGYPGGPVQGRHDTATWSGWSTNNFLNYEWPNTSDSQVERSEFAAFEPMSATGARTGSVPGSYGMRYPTSGMSQDRGGIWSEETPNIFLYSNN